MEVWFEPSGRVGRTPRRSRRHDARAADRRPRLFRIGLLELLERRGIEVIDAVGDCDVGMRLARDCAPDVVLLDLRMPGTGGIEILKRMRAEGRTGASPCSPPAPTSRT
jgi:DNA-binding NarL/FixJ family response regulator